MEQRETILAEWPRNEKGHFICSKEKPMLLEFKKEGRWEHDDVHETDYDSEYAIEYKCHSCGHTWKSEMSE